MAERRIVRRRRHDVAFGGGVGGQMVAAAGGAGGAAFLGDVALRLARAGLGYGQQAFEEGVRRGLVSLREFTERQAFETRRNLRQDAVVPRNKWSEIVEQARESASRLWRRLREIDPLGGGDDGPVIPPGEHPFTAVTRPHRKVMAQAFLMDGTYGNENYGATNYWGMADGRQTVTKDFCNLDQGEEESNRRGRSIFVHRVFCRYIVAKGGNGPEQVRIGILLDKHRNGRAHRTSNLEYFDGQDFTNGVFVHQSIPLTTFNSSRGLPVDVQATTPSKYDAVNAIRNPFTYQRFELYDDHVEPIGDYGTDRSTAGTVEKVFSPPIRIDYDDDLPGLNPVTSNYLCVYFSKNLTTANTGATVSGMVTTTYTDTGVY